MKEEENQRTVLVTGGATGLGDEIALKLQNADFQVATVDVNKGDQNFPNFQCDLTFSLNVEQLFDPDFIPLNWLNAARMYWPLIWTIII